MGRLRHSAIAWLAGAVLCAAGAAEAGPVEEGYAAYRTGDYGKALALWRPYAENGDAAAQAFLGDLYFAGQGVARDAAQAQFWFKLAAAKGNVAAAFNLGLAAEETKAPAQAQAWYKKAASGGSAPAMLALARLARGGGDAAGAARWTEKAASTGDALAQDEMGTLCRLGEGVDPDLARARDWYRKAAEQGLPEAENDLGMMYRLGAGAPPDYERAFGWLYRAAEHGVGAAKFNLGVMYALGLGAAKDPVEAYVWYRAAIAGDDASARAQARSALALLKSQMKPAEVAEAERRAAR